MTSPGLTKLTQAARSRRMQRIGQGAGRSRRRAWGAAASMKLWIMLAGASMVAGCISVNAPDKPIVIELNINIKQEVIYRLSQDAGNTIESNPGIF
jgi:hypothetical protein